MTAHKASKQHTGTGLAPTL